MLDDVLKFIITLFPETLRYWAGLPMVSKILIVIAVALGAWAWWMRSRRHEGISAEDMNRLVDPIVEKYGEAQRMIGAQAMRLAQSKEETDRVKAELTRAIRRAEAVERQGGGDQARAAIEQLRAKGDLGPLQNVLVRDRDHHRDDLIQRDREIADVAYLRGDISAATQAVDEILSLQPEDMGALNRKGHIHRLRGELDLAEKAYDAVVQLAEKNGDQQAQAAGLGGLGLIYQTRGELDRAEEMHKKALAINEQLGWREGMANEYGTLGLIYEMRGELDLAEEMQKKALAINEQLGQREGMACDYGNLGLIYRTRGDLDRAEEMLNKSLEIEEQLGRRKGMASAYGNLGVLYMTRGELDRAEEMLNKSLEIEEQLGRREGMASDYGNLGVIYILRGEPNRAEEMHKKALAIFEQLARFPQHAFRIRNRRGWAARKSSRAKPGFSPSACSGEHPLVRPVVFLG